MHRENDQNQEIDMHHIDPGARDYPQFVDDVTIMALVIVIAVEKSSNRIQSRSIYNKCYKRMVS